MDIHALTDQVEEISRRYATRFDIDRSADWFVLKLQEEVGELTQAHLMREGQARTKNLAPNEIDAAFRAEVADVLAQVLLLARYHGIDVVDEVERKWLIWRSVSRPTADTSTRGD